jgi:hypothetical protein
MVPAARPILTSAARRAPSHAAGSTTPTTQVPAQNVRVPVNAASSVDRLRGSPLRARTCGDSAGLQAACQQPAARRLADQPVLDTPPSLAMLQRDAGATEPQSLARPAASGTASSRASSRPRRFGWPATCAPGPSRRPTRSSPPPVLAAGGKSAGKRPGAGGNIGSRRRADLMAQGFDGGRGGGSAQREKLFG